MNKQKPPLNVVTPALSTRERILQVAQQRFSLNGFYGTSIAEVAAAVGIKKPSLLHHFASKEKLYGAVLQLIADNFSLAIDTASQSDRDEKKQFTAVIESFYSWNKEQPEQAILILREMLDNPARAASANNWYLASFIERMVGIVEAGQTKGVFKPVPALAFIYNLIGAQHYFVVTLPTLKQILSANDYKQLLQQQRQNLSHIIEQQLFL